MIFYGKNLLLNTGDGDSGDLSLWQYTTNATGKIILEKYLGSDYGTQQAPVYVPTAKGKSYINDWVNTTVSGTTDENRTAPFYNNADIQYVDLQNVPFVNNSMSRAFLNCYNLLGISNINNDITSMELTFRNCFNFNQNITIPNSVTDMERTFYGCLNFNQNITIPNSVTDMYGTFQLCVNFNQNITIPNSVTNMYGTFMNCNSFNQNITIPNSVTDMAFTFASCHNFNQNITIPNSVTSLSSTFNGCNKLNQNIQIPDSVTSMERTFQLCFNFNQNITIPNSVTNIAYTFYSCSGLGKNIQILSTEIENCAYYSPSDNSLRRNVYIYFKYANGVFTKTYNTFKSSPAYYTNGATGGTNALANRRNTYVYNAGLSPW